MISAIMAGILSLPILSLRIWGQTTDTQTPSKQGGYVFHSYSREVLTDVTVTDNDGNPVHGLDRSAFHISDNNRPEQLESFQEHAGAPAAVATPSPAPNRFSNAYLLHPPSSINVVLLDITTIDILDQMFLYQELKRFVAALPANQSVAVYQREADGTILLQNFTSDHDLLWNAIQRAIPRLRHPGSWAASDSATLKQMAIFLKQLPGRKNVLWFTGGSNLFLHADPTALPNQPVSESLREIYDELETERIALYPIDARGLTAEKRPGSPDQHVLMADMAEATGGQAAYNDNGVAEIASHVVSTDADFYTLTYRPDDLKTNHKWHKVKVTVDGGPYHLSYRRGFFDDGTSTSSPPRETGTTTRAQGETETVLDSVRHKPIIFEARVEPSIAAQPANPDQPSATVHAPKRNELAYAVHYSVPSDVFTQETVNGQTQINVGAAILAFNRFGRPTGHVVQKLTFNLNAEQLKATKFNFEQQIDLPKGEDYLYIAVWDTTSGRLGTLQLPLDVEKTK